jgi:hypothetical protein
VVELVGTTSCCFACSCTVSRLLVSLNNLLHPDAGIVVAEVGAFMVAASIGLAVGVRGTCLAGKAMIVVQFEGSAFVGSVGRCGCGAVTVVGSVGLVVVGGGVIFAASAPGVVVPIRIFSKFDTYGMNFL